MGGGDWSDAPNESPAVDSELSKKMVAQLTMNGLTLDAVAHDRLREVAAEMHAEFDAHGHAKQDVPFLCATSAGPVHANFTASGSPGSPRLEMKLSSEGASRAGALAMREATHQDVEPGAVAQAGATILLVLMSVFGIAMVVVITLMKLIVG